MTPSVIEVHLKNINDSLTQIKKDLKEGQQKFEDFNGRITSLEYFRKTVRGNLYAVWLVAAIVGMAYANSYFNSNSDPVYTKPKTSIALQGEKK